MLREELRQRGVRSLGRAVGPYLGIIGDAARSPFSLVLILEGEMEERRDQVEECLALVLPDRVFVGPDDPSETGHENPRE